MLSFDELAALSDDVEERFGVEVSEIHSSRRGTFVRVRSPDGSLGCIDQVTGERVEDLRGIGVRPVHARIYRPHADTLT